VDSTTRRKIVALLLAGRALGLVLVALVMVAGPYAVACAIGADAIEKEGEKGSGVPTPFIS
jgi:hypothetical protein